MEEVKGVVVGRKVVQKVLGKNTAADVYLSEDFVKAMAQKYDVYLDHSNYLDDDLEKAKAFQKLLKESLDEIDSVIYTQVDTDSGDRVYLKGIHFVNRTGVYMVAIPNEGSFVVERCGVCNEESYSSRA